jgi:protein-tyrosine phosphatase
VFSWFRKDESIVEGTPLEVDVHSHLLPGLDDGVKSIDDAIAVIETFQRLGYKKLITSPHVMSDGFRNTDSTILNALDQLRVHLQEKGISIEVEAIAEYYLDEVIMQRMLNDESFLTFNKKHLLFETNFISEPFNLKEFIFRAMTKGYTPVLAHPERYLYLQADFSKVQDLYDRGVLFQVNINSITGYYSKQAQALAHRLIDKGWVHMLGSDCHSLQHIAVMQDARVHKYYKKALALPLLNNSL